MKKVCDLHTHSVFSDGTWTPEQLVLEAESQNLSAIALTDHNTVDGLGQFMKAAEGRETEAVPGVEFSTDYRGQDIHVVAHYVMPDRFHEVSARMEDGKRKKEESNLRLVENLGRAGFPLDYEKIKAATPGGQVNRAHIAGAMLKKGWVRSRQEAFSKFLEPGCGLYQAPKRPEILEIIGFIRSIGAVPILAHPFLKLNEMELRELLEKACPAGLQGMETEYVSFDPETTRLAKSIAGEFHLLESGGSDFHGDNKPGIQLGTGRGNLRVPMEFLEKIRQTARDNGAKF